MGYLHGGASLVLAETLGSVAANFVVDRARQRCLGQEINANHLRPVSDGLVTGTARPFHIGARSQVWSIEIRDPRERLVCISRLTMAVVEWRPESATRPATKHGNEVAPHGVLPRWSRSRSPPAARRARSIYPTRPARIVTRPTQTPVPEATPAAPNSPQTVDSPAGAASPAPEVRAAQARRPGSGQEEAGRRQAAL